MKVNIHDDEKLIGIWNRVAVFQCVFLGYDYNAVRIYEYIKFLMGFNSK